MAGAGAGQMGECGPAAVCEPPQPAPATFRRAATTLRLRGEAVRGLGALLVAATAGGVTAAVAAGRVPGAPGGLLVCGAKRGRGGVVGGRGGDAYGKEVFLPRHRPTVWRRRGCPQRRHPGDERGQRGVGGSVGGWRRVSSGDGQHADCGGQGGGGGWLARGCLWRWRRGWGDRGGGWRSSVALPPTTAGAATAQRGQRGCCCVGGKALTTQIIVPCWEPAMAGVKMAVALCRRGAGMPRWR